jgi:hypothetical protein
VEIGGARMRFADRQRICLSLTGLTSLSFSVSFAAWVFREDSDREKSKRPEITHDYGSRVKASLVEKDRLCLCCLAETKNMNNLAKKTFLNVKPEVASDSDREESGRKDKRGGVWRKIGGRREKDETIWWREEWERVRDERDEDDDEVDAAEVKMKLRLMRRRSLLARESTMNTVVGEGKPTLMMMRTLVEQFGRHS